MIKSMTGYGRAEKEIRGKVITVEMKSVNHRYFEFACRTSRGYAFLEDKLKSYVNSRVYRGKIDMFVSVISVDEEDAVEVMVNHSVASGYCKAMAEIAQRYNIENDTTASMIARFPDVLTTHKAPDDEQQVLSDVLEVAEEAVDKFVAMREAEGRKLYEDVLSRADAILKIVEIVEERSPKIVEEYEKRLRDRIEELLGSNTYDPQRVLTEVAIFADKVAVAEETVRLRSHISQLHSYIDSDGSIGKKLDFVIQEMNREANTIGSKIQDAELAHQVVNIKGEIEKIREQVQNIE
ncbi:MAG: YicC/YloC family endoribonuclease [Eubacteriales bacterium]|nr:YicC/YloC family endoribonuclease [Eubacteriales bacterium]